MTVVDLPTALGRTFLCTVCRERVIVYEIPNRHLDPVTYVCGDCLTGTVTETQTEKLADTPGHLQLDREWLDRCDR